MTSLPAAPSTGPSATTPRPGRRRRVLGVVGLVVGTVVALLTAAPAGAAPSDNPVGSYDVLTSALGDSSITVGGWSFDPNTADSSSVDTYADGVWLGRTVANRSRPDIAAAYPGYGPAHGFLTSYPMTGGTHTVCTYGINIGVGENILLGCKTITLDFDPIGSVDLAVAQGGGVRVAGWAFDPSTNAPIQVAVTADGTSIGTLNAGLSRSDIGALYPKYGPLHGYDGTVGGSLGQGSHRICVTALNVGGGSDQALGCKTVTSNVNPYGSFDGASVGTGGVLTVGGWAADPDSPQSLVVDVYSDNTFVMRLPANRPRADVAAAYPAAGGSRGFGGSGGALGQGTHSICVYAINAGPGQNVGLGCKPVTVSIDPFGSFDVAQQVVTSDQILVGGWALDPDTTAPIFVDVYADGVGVQRITANTVRPDIASAYQLGANHGFYATVGHLTQGSHQVCAYAINVGPGSGNPSLGCRTVQISLDPFGSIDQSVRSSATTATVSGWAMDPNTTAPVTVTATVGGRTVATATANGTRADVGSVYGNGSAHGYTLTVPVDASQQSVCITVANVGPGSAQQIGCGDVAKVGATPPSPPTEVTATAGYAQIVVAWKAPVDNGGANVQSYTVTAQPGNITVTVPATVLTATLLRLPPGQTYSVGVGATNVVGNSQGAFAPPVTTSTAPPPQTTTAPVSTSRYIRNLNGTSADTSFYYAAGQADAARNATGHSYVSLLDIGGQTTTGVLLSAIAKYVSYQTLVAACQAYVDGYASRQQAVAPATIAIGTNNDSTVTAQTGALWATQVINPLQAYAAKYPAITIAGANDIEPGFRAGPVPTRQWLSAYLGSTTAPFINNGSADGCSQTSAGSGCNNGWTMNDLYWLSMGAAPGRMAALPQIYFTSMARQWKYISLTGVLTGQPRISFGGILTEVVACQQAGSCTSMDGATAWNTLWGQLQSDARTAVGSLPWATDLRIN